MKIKKKNTGNIIDTLFSIIEERKKTKKRGSYTSFLFRKGETFSIPVLSNEPSFLIRIKTLGV